MGSLGAGSVAPSFRLTACVGLSLGCLLSVACGQAEDTSQADSSASGGTAGSTSSTGGQSESTGGVATGGSEGLASGGSTGIVVSTGGFESTGGVANSASGGEGAGAAPHVAKVCNDPTPSKWGGGVLTCADGSLRRPQVGSCVTEVPRPEPGSTCFAADACCVDADCKEAPFGYCTYGACAYGCLIDSDCAKDWLCLCQAPIGICTPTLCYSDADCPPDRPCSSFNGALRGFACQAPTDACVSNFDCSTGLCSNGVCTPFPG